MSRKTTTCYQTAKSFTAFDNMNNKKNFAIPHAGVFLCDFSKPATYII